jgi:serine/threonine protein kinase
MTIRNGLVMREELRLKSLHELDPLLESQPLSLRASKQGKIESHPRVIFLDADFSLTDSFPFDRRRKSRHVEALGHHCCENEPYAFRYDFEKPFYDECFPIVEPKVHPTCNVMHELTLESDISLLSAKGSWRTAWKVEHEDVVLKMLNLNRKFDHESMDAHAVDIMVMDQLTASPHVIRAHGFCGQSVATEYAPKSGRDYIKQPEIRSTERLKIARDLARGLADLQALRPLHDYHKRGNQKSLTVFAHNDINIANTVEIDGQVKWNDFNIGVLLRQNNGTECRYPVRYKADLWRSPEEVRNTTYVQVEQSDMYGLGNILYQVMARHQPWTHKEPGGIPSIDVIIERKKQGMLPTIPEQYKNSTRTEMHALLFATISCYHPNPEKRPTAYGLAHALGTVYDAVKDKKKLSTRKVRDLFMIK